jgi:pimeloyl-ACP methyl ester carboxylesterase
MRGQMFVQYQIPRQRSHPLPIVMVHGGGQTGVNFLGTPDGRRGWADYFVARGFAVYVIDQPGRGRAAYTPSYGPSVLRDAETIAGRFTAPERCIHNGPARASRTMSTTISSTRRRCRAWTTSVHWRR